MLYQTYRRQILGLKWWGYGIGDVSLEFPWFQGDDWPPGIVIPP